MTPQQESELDSAITRAKQGGIQVIAQGHYRDVTCDRFFVTSGSTTATHIVRLSGNHLICDCPAGQHGRICVHRAACHVLLIDEAVKRQLLPVAVESALELEAEVAVARTLGG